LEIQGAHLPAALHEATPVHTSYVSEENVVTKIRRKRNEEKTTRAKRVVKAGEPDWDFIENGRRSGKPRVTFRPSEERRERWVEILSRKASDSDRKKLVKLLGAQFMRVYIRYRKTVQPRWSSTDEDLKTARAAARLCLLKSVTPRQLIEYWHEHVGDFTGMQFPSLSFLAAPGNVDCVSAIVALGGNVKAKPKAKKRGASPPIHAYSDPSELDSRLRVGLRDAGFDVRTFSDRALLTIQSTARAKSRGVDVFVSSKMRPMVEWAMENLYT
jgi:hypothetical protein